MNKTVLITGASRGIGRECAITFLKHGYNVIVNYNSSEEAALSLSFTLENISHNYILCKADVSNPQEVESMINQANKKFGNIDILINNAAIAQQKLFTDITHEDFKKMFDINIGGIFNCCKAVVPNMINRKYGKIINIASMWGEVGASCEVHYSASKAAVIGFTKALAKELGPSNINVNCVSPGVIDTDMNKNLSEADLIALKDETPLCKIGRTQDIANILLFLASDQASFITGQVIGVNGGFII